MNQLTLGEIARMCGGTVVQGDSGRLSGRVSKDSRSIAPGDLYVALRGERFDGNGFIAAAASAGASGALCDGEVPSGLPEGFGVIQTPDSLSSLALLAADWRKRLPLKAVAITGSSGKTSVKDFTAVVLGARHRTTATVGNLNNAIGLPLSILEADRSHGAAVWEIGMNHRGEIAPLAGICRPDIAVVTGIGSAHIENLGSIDEIAREKGDLLERLSPGGFGIIPEEDKFALDLRSRTPERVIGVGFSKGEIRAGNISPEGFGTRFRIEGEAGSTGVILPVPGEHMVRNALMAVAAGWILGVSVEEAAEALSGATLTGGRLQRRELAGTVFLDDTYNANPESMKAALGTLAAIPAQGRRIAVLGRMGELGEHAGPAYRGIGTSAAEAVEVLVTVGEEATAMAVSAREAGLYSVHAVADTREAASLLSSLARPGDLVLLKASRSARLEEILSLMHP